MSAELWQQTTFVFFTTTKKVIQFSLNPQHSGKKLNQITLYVLWTKDMQTSTAAQQTETLNSLTWLTLPFFFVDQFFPSPK